MGLTGVILTATVRLLPVETSWMSVDTERARDLDDLLARLTATDHHYRYSVAWIDLLARGASTGRAVLTRGDHAPLAALEPPRSPSTRARGRHFPRRGALRRDAPTSPLEFRTHRLPAAPAFVPEGLLGRTTVGLFNEFWYRRAPHARTGELQRISAFFHPSTGSRTGTGSTAGPVLSSTSSSSGTATRRPFAGSWTGSRRAAAPRSSPS